MADDRMAPQGESTPRVQATIVYDTRAQTLPVGVRLVARRARRVLARAGDTELVLQISAAGLTERLNLLGSVLVDGVPLAGAQVRLSGPIGPLEQETGEQGELRLPQLVRGVYRVEVDTGSGIVELSELDLDAER